ncbi:MAG: hypothetical protein V1929_03965 [bacterium]
MKTTTLIAALIATALPCALLAQDGPPPGDMPPGLDMPPGPGPGPGLPPGDPHVGRRGPEMVERWLEQLEDKDPSEYERLVELREDDPDAFRKELRNKLRKEQARVFMDKHPQLRESMMDLPPEERDARMRRLMQAGPGPGGPGPGMKRGMGPDDGGGDMRTPEINAQQEETRKQVAAYKSAATPEEKEKAKAELKTSLGKLFDVREQQRAKEIDEFDRHIAELKAKLEKRQANRDQIIEKRMEEVTSGDELSW